MLIDVESYERALLRKFLDAVRADTSRRRREELVEAEPMPDPGGARPLPAPARRRRGVPARA
jgi:hypothetical protein